MEVLVFCARWRQIYVRRHFTFCADDGLRPKRLLLLLSLLYQQHRIAEACVAAWLALGCSLCKAGRLSILPGVRGLFCVPSLAGKGCAFV